MPFEFDPTMMGMGSMYGGMGMGMYNTNYLGGVSFKPNLTQDTVHIINKKDAETRKDMATVAKLALGVIGLSMLHRLFKGKKTPWYNKLANWTSSHVSSRPVGSKTWYKPWTWLNKSASTPTP